MKRVLAKGAGYLDTELARLKRMMRSTNISPAKLPTFKIRSNILKAFDATAAPIPASGEAAAASAADAVGSGGDADGKLCSADAASGDAGDGAECGGGDRDDDPSGDRGVQLEAVQKLTDC